TIEVVRFNINDRLAEIITALESNRFRRVPIESQDKLVGIISRRDIITYLFAIELQQRGHETVTVGGKYFD
ncbi:MAG: CBS domain-containing protein, partial [Candidatus Brocadiia bacterium]